MKKAATTAGPASPTTSLRLDHDLKYRAQGLALKNKRARKTEDASLTDILNRALAEYLKKRGA